MCGSGSLTRTGSSRRLACVAPDGESDYSSLGFAIGAGLFNDGQHFAGADSRAFTGEDLLNDTFLR